MGGYLCSGIGCWKTPCTRDLSPTTDLPEVTRKTECGKPSAFYLLISWWTSDRMNEWREDSKWAKANAANAFAGGKSCSLTGPWESPPGSCHVCGAQVLAHRHGHSRGCSTISGLIGSASSLCPLLQRAQEAGRKSPTCPLLEKHFALVEAQLSYPNLNAFFFFFFEMLGISPR